MDNDQTNTLETQVPIEAPVEAQSNNATPTESPKEQPVEKVFSQSETNAIAAKEARKAAERAEARVRAEYESRMQQQSQEAIPQSVGGMPQLSTEEIQRMIRQEAYTMSQQHQAKQIEQNWLAAMEAERIADPDFADLYEAIGIEAQPHLILAMAGMENKAQVVKDLAKNPSKYANILTLANGGSPRLAQLELNKLSESIKANEAAKKQPKVDAPLSTIRASNIGGDDGKFSTTDFRNQDWLRG